MQLRNIKKSTKKKKRSKTEETAAADEKSSAVFFVLFFDVLLYNEGKAGRHNLRVRFQQLKDIALFCRRFLW